MKIGLVVYGSLEKITGGNIYDRMLVGRLRQHGDQIELISLTPRNYGSRFIDNLSFRLPGGLDVLLQDELTHPSLLAANLANRSYPIVSIVHNLHSLGHRPAWQNSLFRLVERQYLRSVDGLVFNSAATMGSVSTGLEVSRPFVVAPPGGDRLGTSTPEAVKARAREPGPLRLLFLANVTALKGLDVLLDALALVDPARFELDVVGSVGVEPQYANEMKVRASKLEAQVRFHGILDDQPLVDVLQRAQVMVIPSYYEGFGIAYLEGMAFGLPAIGSAAGAIPELITAGSNGYLVAPGDSKTIATHLTTFDTERNLLSRMGVAALEFFQTRPTWDQGADLVRDFLVEQVRTWRSRRERNRA